MEGGRGGGGAAPTEKGEDSRVQRCVCTCMCARGPAAWSVITRWLYNVTQSAYQHFRCQLPRAVPLVLHPHLPHVRPLKDRRDPNPYTNQPTLCVPPIGQASRPKGKEQLWAQPIAAPYTLQHVQRPLLSVGSSRAGRRAPNVSETPRAEVAETRRDWLRGVTAVLTSRAVSFCGSPLCEL